MTELRKRMIKELQLRKMSQRTQEMYVRAIRQLAEHHHMSPITITFTNHPEQPPLFPFAGLSSSVLSLSKENDLISVRFGQY